jgi:Cu+-exporting ATPase
MKHTYKITGMTCQGCRSKVENALNGIDGISAKVTLEPAEAIIMMDKHIPTEKLQEALSAVGNYSIAMSGFQKITEEKQVTDHSGHQHHASAHHDHGAAPVKANMVKTGDVYYCPMHCEGDKTYDKPGHCPVCGMDLLKQPVLKHTTQFTCPMHPEIIRDQPGSCPICGMDLVPLGVNLEEEDKTYETLLRKFKIATVFTVPIFLIAMSEMIPGNPIFKLMDLKYWNWVQFAFSIPVVFYATWMFFQRA